MGLVLVGVAAVCAVACGYNLWQALEASRRVTRHKRAVGSLGEGASRGTAEGLGSSMSDKVIDFMYGMTRNLSLKRSVRIAPSILWGQKWFEGCAQTAGIAGEISFEGFSEVRCRLLLVGAAAGFVVGLMLSVELALVLAVVGAYFGWGMPKRAIETRIKWRAHETERHLPEMLDVVALGMRSGLSFDASLALYAQHFDTVLSRELASAQRQWSSGLARRDEALQKVAASYDSVVFGRVIETILRSIRYGSSMVQSLERDAAEARDAYQAVREERIAKAPVKMMVPTGVLILPAMLIMILGPVLLELMQGGF